MLGELDDSANQRANPYMQPTGFASLRSARLRLMRNRWAATLTAHQIKWKG